MIIKRAFTDEERKTAWEKAKKLDVLSEPLPDGYEKDEPENGKEGNSVLDGNAKYLVGQKGADARQIEQAKAGLNAAAIKPRIECDCPDCMEPGLR